MAKAASPKLPLLPLLLPLCSYRKRSSKADITFTASDADADAGAGDAETGGGGDGDAAVTSSDRDDGVRVRMIDNLLFLFSETFFETPCMLCLSWREAEHRAVSARVGCKLPYLC